MFWSALFYIFGLAVLWGMYRITSNTKCRLMEHRIQLKELETHMICLELTMMQIADKKLDLHDLKKIKQSVKRFSENLEYNRRSFGVE